MGDPKLLQIAFEDLLRLGVDRPIQLVHPAIEDPGERKAPTRTGSVKTLLGQLKKYIYVYI